MEKLLDIWKTVEARQAIISIVIVLIILIIWKIIKKIIRVYNKKKSANLPDFSASSSIQSVIYDTIKVGIVAIIILVILQINGINVTSLLAGLGVASAVIGLALQDFFKDIIMGVHVLMDDFYKLGDMVQFGDDEGTVISFNLRTTKIRSLSDGDIITICNRNIDRIVKSSSEVYIRIPLPYDVPVGRSAELMEKICEAAGKCEHIEECRFLGTTEYSASAVQHLVRIDIESPEWKLATRRSVLLAAREVLEAENVSIPFDQLDVHMK